ncbi:rolling circle replication-associated protein [Lacrimispora brassicae]
MEPYNVKVITYPDLTRQYRIYHRDVVSKQKKSNRCKNPFDDYWTRDIKGDIGDCFSHSAMVSMNRSQGKVYNYARCNDWDWFVTFTFDRKKVDRYSFDACRKKMSNWLQNFRKKYPDSYYLVVSERHKDGAYHFHGLFGGVDEEQLVWTGKYVRRTIRGSGRTVIKMTKEKIYKFDRYKLGFMTATRVRDRKRVTSYITKYITKELCASTYKCKRYWNSRNLILPTEETYNFDDVDRFILSTELSQEAKYEKCSFIQYGEMTQGLKLFEL